MAVDTHTSSIALSDDRLTRTFVTWLERRRVVRRWLHGRQLRVAADVILWRSKSGCSSAPRQAMARLATWLRFVSKVVWIVLAAVVRVWVCFEASVDQSCGCVKVNLANLCSPGCQGALSRLGADVTDRSCEEWVDELSVVLIHNLAVNESGVLRLLHKRSLHEAQLERQDGSEKHCQHNCDRRPRIQRCCREESIVKQDMAWRKQSERGQVERLRVPNGNLPNLPLRVRVCARRCRCCSNSLLDVAQWRRRCRRAVDTYALRRRCVGRKINGLLKKAIVSFAEESVEGVEAAYDRQGVHEEGRLRISRQLCTDCYGAKRVLVYSQAMQAIHFLSFHRYRQIHHHFLLNLPGCSNL